MKPVDLHSGAARIRKGLQDLLRDWEAAGEHWNDSVTESFYRERLEPVLPIVKNTLDAAGRMQLMLEEARRELES